jgi:hypothetical protein
VPVTRYEQRTKQVARKVPVTRQIMVPRTVPVQDAPIPPKASPQAARDRKTSVR